MRDKTQQVVNHIKRNQTSQPFPVAEKKKVVPFREYHLFPYQLNSRLQKPPKIRDTSLCYLSFHTQSTRYQNHIDQACSTQRSRKLFQDNWKNKNAIDMKPLSRHLHNTSERLEMAVEESEVEVTL